MINKTYRKDPPDNTLVYILALVFVILFLLIIWDNCSGQSVQITRSFDACSDIETAYVIVDFPTEVHSINLKIYYWNWALTFLDCCMSDALMGGYPLWFDTGGMFAFTWYDLDCLPKEDTLLSLRFSRLSDSDLLFYTPDCEIGDYNGNAISTTFLSGWLRCVVTGINEPFENIEQLNKRNYNLLGQYVRTH